MNVTTLSKVETLRHFISSQNEELKKRLFAKRTITERSWLNGQPIQTTS